MADHTTELPISLVAHTVFCERRAWLEAAGERVVHSNIEAGLAAHSVVDQPSHNRHRTTSVDVSLPELGLTGKCDVVRASDAGSVTLVEYKSTPARRIAQVTEANVVQLALQRFCLEADGMLVLGQEVYFTNHVARFRSISPTRISTRRGRGLREPGRSLLPRRHPSRL